VKGLVLSLFPGIDILGRGFEEEGWCVVRGPDVLWGGDIRGFHPPAGRFEGVIGGPPCQAFSRINQVNRARYGDESIAPDLIPEFRRVVQESGADWYVMENVTNAYAPSVDGYAERKIEIDNHWFGVSSQTRRRAFWSNLILHVETPALVPTEKTPAITSKGHADWRRCCASGHTIKPADAAEKQGLSRDFLGGAPFTQIGKMRVLANAVPLPMARAIAKAVGKALEKAA
jgi:DNA (cytosine-5)-methyltransferase 1